MNFWQVAAGDKNRNYVDLCLKWDVVLNGPGGSSPWPSCQTELAEYTGPKKLADLRYFCEQMTKGDLIVLRLGTDENGVGMVEGGYEWHEAFGDVDGWDLKHVRRVRWLWKAMPKEVFPVHTLKFGPTVQLLTAQTVKDWINGLSLPNVAPTGPLATLPQAGPVLTVEEIGDCLFDYGIGSTSVSSVVHQISDLNRMARWYHQTAVLPSEHETISHLTVPLFHALGWTPQRMSVEWNRVDIALFDNLPRRDANLSVVVEAKRMDQSCFNAVPQAQYYALLAGREACRRLVVTDGVRYVVYRRFENTFQAIPDSYLNLAEPHKTYPIWGCEGGHRAMLLMSSGWTDAAQMETPQPDKAPEEDLE